MNNIVFFIQSYFSKRDFIRFGIKYFLKKNINVKIFNVAPVTRSLYYKNYKPRNKFKYKGEKIFFKKEDIISKIKTLNSEDIVINNFSLNRETKFLVKTLGEYKIKFGHYSFGHQPVPPKLILEVIKLSFQYPISALFTAWNKLKNYNHNLLPPPHFVLCAGKKTYLSHKKNGKIKKLIKIPSFDYDKYLQFKKRKVNLRKSHKKRKYIVYLDSFYFHPDQLYASDQGDDKFPPDKVPSLRKYYNPLNKFFLKLKKKTNMDIKIAAHPSANYKKNPYKFGKIYHDQVIELIKDCQFVVAKASLAMNIAIMFKKPILFILNDSWRYYVKREIYYIAKYFKQNPLNISNSDYENFDFLKNIKINHLAYKNFTKEFIVDVGNNKKKQLSYEIILKNIHKI